MTSRVHTEPVRTDTSYVSTAVCASDRISTGEEEHVHPYHLDVGGPRYVQVQGEEEQEDQ